MCDKKTKGQKILEGVVVHSRMSNVGFRYML